MPVEPVGGKGQALQVTKSYKDSSKWNDYMSKVFLHLAAREAFFLGMRQTQERADSLQAATRRPTLGSKPLKTTSLRCFQISQQHRMMMGWATSR